MKSTKNYLAFCLLAALTFLCACKFGINRDKHPPPLDWENLDGAHIDKAFSAKDWFGNYAIIFLTSTKGIYTTEKLKNYASAHGWFLADSAKIDSVDANMYYGIVRAAAQYLIKREKNNTPPIWFSDNMKLYKFGFPLKKGEKAPHKPFHGEMLVSVDERSACVYPVMDDSSW